MVAEGLDVDRLAVDADDDVAGLQAGRCGRAVGATSAIWTGPSGVGTGHAHDVDHGEGDDGQQEVHGRAGGQHEGADRARLAGEAAGGGRVFFAEHLDEGAEGDPVDRVDDAVAFETPRRGGRPKPNSSTVMPVRRAVTKCPNSWTNIIRLRMGRKASRMFMRALPGS